MVEPEELDFVFVGSKSDGGTFSDGDIERLMVSIISWAEDEGLAIGGGFMPIMDSGYNEVDTRLRATRDEALRLLREGKQQVKACTLVEAPILKDWLAEVDAFLQRQEPTRDQ